jgi:hypothetical protein
VTLLPDRLKDQVPENEILQNKALKDARVRRKAEPLVKRTECGILRGVTLQNLFNFGSDSSRFNS